ncbi:MAG: sugar phosphate isomerase/epimerase [Bacilli bacterium]|jgi:sugar phosphate isomerase/epimerase|nr:sugar phosphate isomerase/epimerase [Bacilli bacterium]MCH4278048.1 sugar phosphate isomerase/epimerase [Bacilli bacterium]
MDNIKYGVQQLQLGSALKSKKKAEAILETVRTSGFSGIELNGFMIRKTPFIVRALTSLSGMPIKKSCSLSWPTLIKGSGLEVLSIHEDLGRLESNLEKVLEEAKEYNTSYIVLTGMYGYEYSDFKSVHSLAARLNKVGQALEENGLHFLYHNHNVEFVSCLGKTKAYEVLMKELNPSYVNFEFDSYWAAVGGVDYCSLLESLGERAIYHHICDRGNLNKGKFMTPIIKEDSVELGLGNMNIKRLLEIDKSNHAKAVILEQHHNYIDNDLANSLSISGTFLAERR